MNAIEATTRIARGGLVGLALFGAWSSASLLLTQTFSPTALPVCLVVGMLVSLRATVDAGISRPRDEPAWSRGLLVVVVLAVGAAMAFGALETPSRHWDGVCTWDLRAGFLTTEPRIDQDFFAAREVFSPSRDYPLLQPLCVASVNRLVGDGMGRVVFPALYFLIVALVLAAVTGRTNRPELASLAAIAVGVTPALVNPTMGAVDSGFAEAFLATAVAGTVAGMVLADPLLMIAGVTCGVLVKPEGLVYGALAVAAAWSLDRPRLLRPMMAAWLLSAALWIPLQQRLAAPIGQAPPALAVWFPILLLGAIVLASDSLLRRRSVSARTRVLIALGAVPVLGLALPVLIAITGDSGGTMALYLGDATRPLERLQRLPAILAGFVDRAVLKLDFALTFVIVAALLGTYLAGRRRPAQAAATAFLVLGLVSVIPPFLLSPEPDVQHHIRSSMTRLLIHWVGATWILAAVWLDDIVPVQRDASPAG